ncbi:MAG TPA: hypothetical protein VJX30_15670 [Terriglobales bacterium]|jgi:hypothetical protein|nr:hypothetical protein [Terriglobales bacterium]
MFEAEVEMERRSSILPLLLMMCLVAGIVGLATYVLFQVRGKTPLRAQDASGIVAAALQGPGPAIIHFRTGLVKPSVDEKPGDPNYRLLEKAGIIKLAKAAQGSVLVSITPEGERLMSGVPGFKKSKEADGTFSYQAPLAHRQLVSIAGVDMNGANNAIVEYTWKWVPNQLGNVFDAGGPLVKSFNLWERQTLINKYEVDFYNGEPTKSTLALARSGRDWKISKQ